MHFFNFIFPSFRFPSASQTGGLIALSIGIILKRVWSGEVKVMSPKPLARLMALKHPKFDGKTEEDAYEALVAIRNFLDDDLKVSWRGNSIFSHK